MDQDNALLSELDQLLGMPSSIGKASTLPDPNLWLGYPSKNLWDFSTQLKESSPLSMAPELKPTAIEQNVNNFNTSSQTLSGDSLEAFDALKIQAQNNEVVENPSMEPVCRRSPVLPSVQARFNPPKGPRKQHRTGFRQLPGSNGKIKRGRPSKKEYKLGGIEIDMYYVKGVTLHGPVKSLEEVEGAAVITKRAKKEKRKKEKSTKSQLIPETTTLATSSGALAVLGSTGTERPDHEENQLVLFSPMEDTSPNSHRWQLAEVTSKGQSETQECFQSIIPKFDNDTSSPFSFSDLSLLSSADLSLQTMSNYSDPNFISGSGSQQVPSLSALNSQPIYSLVDRSGTHRFLNVSPVDSTHSSPLVDNSGFQRFSFPAFNPSQTSSQVYLDTNNNLQEFSNLEPLGFQKSFTQFDNNNNNSQKLFNFPSLNPTYSFVPFQNSHNNGSPSYPALGLECDPSSHQSFTNSMLNLDTGIHHSTSHYVATNPLFYQSH